MMKKLFSIFVLFLLCAAAAQAAAERNVLARVTVYWRSEGCGLHASSNGIRLRNGHCAVDPRKIPFGSTVMFPDGPCLAVDTGPDVVNRKAARRSGRNATERNALVIDRYFESKRDALEWASKHSAFITLRVLPVSRRSPTETRIAQAEPTRTVDPVRKLPLAYSGCVMSPMAD